MYKISLWYTNLWTTINICAFRCSLRFLIGLAAIGVAYLGDRLERTVKYITQINSTTFCYSL